MPWWVSIKTPIDLDDVLKLLKSAWICSIRYQKAQDKNESDLTNKAKIAFYNILLLIDRPIRKAT